MGLRCPTAIRIGADDADTNPLGHWLLLARISESAFCVQPVVDLTDPLFTGPQHRGAAMHRVLSEHEVVGVRSRRPKNELRIGVRMEVDRACGRLEDREFARLHTLRNPKASRA